MKIDQKQLAKIQHDFNNGLAVSRMLVHQLQRNIQESSSTPDQKTAMQETSELLFEGIARLQVAMEAIVVGIGGEYDDL